MRVVLIPQGTIQTRVTQTNVGCCAREFLVGDPGDGRVGDVFQCH